MEVRCESVLTDEAKEPNRQPNDQLQKDLLCVTQFLDQDAFSQNEYKS